MRAYVNRFAAWMVMPADGLAIKTNAPGVVYYDRQKVAQVSDVPFVRYAKNYYIKKGKKKIGFCLFILTPDQNKIAVEKALDAVSAKFDFEYIQKVLKESSMTDFSWTDEYYERNL